MSSPRRAGSALGSRALLVVLAAVSLTPGCKKSPKRVVPDYPTLQMHGSKLEVEGATVFQNRAITADFKSDVAKFYDEKLLGQPGWEKEENPLDGYIRYTNGNMSAEGSMWIPIDASKSGGVVEVIAGENQTAILVFESVPKPAK